MWARLLGFALTFLVIAYMFHMMMGSDKDVKKAINSNPTVVEQKQVLKGAGVNPDDPEALRKYTIEQAKQIDEYQHSADGLEKP